MPRLKSAYRPQIEAAEINSAAAPINPAHVDFPPLELNNIPSEEVARAEPPPPAQQPDASDALRAQVEAVKHSEQIHRPRQQMAEAESRRASWLQNTPQAQEHYA